MIITNVGLAMDTLENKFGVISGRATIYSKDTDDAVSVEYCDDFTFVYDTADGLVVANVDDSVFGDYLETIDAMLVENLKTNVLRR